MHLSLLRHASATAALLAGLPWWMGLRSLSASLRGGPGHHGAPNDHFDGQRFRNRHAAAGRSLADLWRWQRTRAPKPWPAWRGQAVAPRLPVHVGTAEVAITFINHVTFLLQFAGLTLLTDPVYSMRASPFQWIGPRRRHAPGIAFEELPHIDGVFISHNHYDHLDLPTLQRLEQAHAPLIITGLGNGVFLREQGLRQVVELDWWQHTSLHAAQMLFTPAQHWSSRGPGNRNRTLWGGLWVTMGARSVYFCGDSGHDAALFEELRRRCGSPDVALLPIGAYEPRWFMHEQHMNPSEAVQAHVTLGAALSVGAHFGCFPLTDEGIDDPLIELARAREAQGVGNGEFLTLAPGETLIWRAGSRPLHVTA